MKNIIFIIVIVCVAFVSCDGRKSKSVSLKESIEEFKEEQSKIEIVSYYPKEFTEIVTDTTISNNVKIHIKNYSLANQSILMSSNDTSVPKNSIKHRVFESEIVVSSPTKEILNTHISAGQFKTLFSDTFWNNATLQHVWVNQELSSSNDIKLDISFINPKDNSYKLYRMSINGNGEQKIDFIEERT